MTQGSPTDPRGRRPARASTTELTPAQAAVRDHIDSLQSLKWGDRTIRWSTAPSELTHPNGEDGRHAPNFWTREDLAALGQSYPPPRGWRKALIAGGIMPTPIPVEDRITRIRRKRAERAAKREASDRRRFSGRKLSNNELSDVRAMRADGWKLIKSDWPRIVAVRGAEMRFFGPRPLADGERQVSRDDRRLKARQERFRRRATLPVVAIGDLMASADAAREGEPCAPSTFTTEETFV